MALKTQIFVVTDPGRDHGKRFLITEMPALKAEDWAYRAILALTHAGIDIPDYAQGSGMAGLAQAGIRALARIEHAEVKPLLKEMLSTVEVLPDPKNPMLKRPLVMNEMEGDDIEELSTLVALRFQWFALHTDFFFAVLKSQQIFGQA